MYQPVDHALLVRTARGDDAAARMLWAQVGPRLVALARAMLRSYGGEAAAMDVVQTVMCRVVGSERGQVSKVEDVAAWLARGVRNECLNYRRGIDRRDAREAVATAPARHGTRGAGSQPTPAPDVFADLTEALNRLPDNLREVVLLKHAAGLTFDQMAISLNENRSTVATRYAKALKVLREPPAAQAPAQSKAMNTPTARPSSSPTAASGGLPQCAGTRPSSDTNPTREVHT
ncbi:MAG TPA: sigma-70 family RNA polymerase sigma factor [Phycisphaerales bacterium]|nr:sigma-70 family RNA polymerase sigma factor [Phycisphaerales bacterium]